MISRLNKLCTKSRRALQPIDISCMLIKYKIHWNSPVSKTNDLSGGTMRASGSEYREAFISLLNNKDKARERGFVVFVHGAVDLEPLETICIDPTFQSYNHCLTARYGAGTGDILASLIKRFVDEAYSFLGDTGYNMKMQSQAVQSGIVQPAKLGFFQPTPPDGEWRPLLQNFKGIADQDHNINIDEFFSIVQSTLKVGERLLLFCELSDVPDNATLEDVGFDDVVVKKFMPHLPERLGLVFSGLPSGLDVPGLRESFLSLEVGEDYGGAQGTAPERSQPLRNDSPRGEDRLAIASEVNALADAIAGKDLDPPLVVGILGGWGSGKSFILHLLQERLRFIRNQDVSDDVVRASNPYVGHPYIVHFDAWTYAKSDLWASLMERILFGLDQQLNLERTVAKQYDLRKGFDLWEIIAHSTSGQLDALEKELGQEAVKLIKDWKSGAGTAQALWSALEKLREEELKNLEDAKKELAKKQKQSEKKLQDAQIASDRKLLASRQSFEKELSDKHQQHKNTLNQKQAALETVQASIVADVDKKIDSMARDEAWVPIREEFKSFFGAVANDILKKSGVQSDGAPVSIWMIEREVKLTAKYITGIRKSPIGIALLVFAIISVILTWVFAQIKLASVLPTLAGYTGILGGVFGSAYAALTKTNRWFEERQTAYEAKMEKVKVDKASLRENMLQKQLEAQILPLETEIADIQNQFSNDIKAFEETEVEKLKVLRMNEEKALEGLKERQASEIQVLQEKVEEHARRAGIPGQSKSLVDLIQKRLASGYYHERLGILHQVQKDLQEITEALLPANGYNEDLFPRGMPRIIILIDDLDRCPPQQVVKVLEAAQLLVKTRLFVVVIAMDVRYITRALEKEYEGILVHEGDPSGLDYAEKIVQIPYRVRPIAPEAMTTYLRSQMVVRQMTEPTHTDSEGGNGHLPPATITAPGQSNMRVNETLPPEIQEFEEDELELLKNASIAVSISPRATKRMVNVMKLIKNIWYRKSVPGYNLKVVRAIMLLLTLSASYPEAMARILDDLERTYHNPMTFDSEKNLSNVLQDIIQRWSIKEGIAEDWVAITRNIQNDKLLDADLTVGELGLDNLQIVRSFSFLGEVEMPLVEKRQELAVDLTAQNDNLPNVPKGRRKSIPKK